ncbi:MAG: hypothetical protein Rhob2KO_09040 [Rhodopirellula baltica]
MGVAQQRLAILNHRDWRHRDPFFAAGFAEATPSFGLFGNAGDGTVSDDHMVHALEVIRSCDHDEQPTNPFEFRDGLAFAGVDNRLADWDGDLSDSTDLGLVVAEKTVARCNR